MLPARGDSAPNVVWLRMFSRANGLALSAQRYKLNSQLSNFSLAARVAHSALPQAEQLQLAFAAWQRSGLAYTTLSVGSTFSLALLAFTPKYAFCILPYAYHYQACNKLSTFS